MDHTALTAVLLLCCSASSAKVRLAHGVSPCAGRLEMETEGKWTSVNDLKHEWNLSSAAALCRQLDCGSVVLLQRTVVPDNRDNRDYQLNRLIIDLQKSYPSLSVQVQINCSDSVRLVNGSGPCSGRLEVKFDQSWSPVSQDAFHQEDAEVVCRELNCGASPVVRSWYYGKPEALGQSKEFRCRGQESKLKDCDISDKKHSGDAVEVTCSETEVVRLVGGFSRCSGTLEMKQSGEWKPVLTDDWNLNVSDELCQRLNCGSPFSRNRRTTNTPRVVWKFKPGCDELQPKCFTELFYSKDSIETSCSDSVRLMNESSWCSGRLEVEDNQFWHSICENAFDHQDAEVVCKELDCGVPLAPPEVLFGETGTRMWSKVFNCDSHESSVLKCESSELPENTCPPGRAIGLTCSDPDVRLVGGANRCHGKLEVKHNRDWRTAFSRYDGWNQKVADVVCGRLDCGSSVRTITRKVEQPVWWINSSCIQNKSAVRECLVVDDWMGPYSLEITCSASIDSVRLVDGAGRCSGRLEVKSNQLWSSVCDDVFDQQDANVVCQELGCGALSDLQGKLYRETDISMWNKEFYCEGSESSLKDCSSSAVKPCSAGKAVHLTCSEYIRLVGEDSQCSGTLEMFQLGEWRSVDNWNSVWSKRSAAVVCAQLGCGTAVSTGHTSNYGENRSVWRIWSSCVMSVSGLQECPILDDHIQLPYLEVICSGSRSDSITKLVVLLVGMIIVTSANCFYYKTRRMPKLGQKRNPGALDSSGNKGQLDEETKASGEEQREMFVSHSEMKK